MNTLHNPTTTLFQHTGARKGMGVLAVALLLIAPRLSALEVSPESIVFEDKESAQELRITHNGEPVPQDAIFEHELYVNAHTYAEMLTVTPKEGGVSVTPTSFLEVGSYDLEIDTRFGTVKVKVYSPLTQMADSLENRAAAKGITVEELKAEMGLTQTSSRNMIELGVPPVYYEGQVLNISLAAEPGRLYQWSINDEVLGAPTGQAELNYPLENPGVLFISLVETNQEGAVTARASALTQVVAIPAMKVETMANRSFTLRAAPDFQHHSWTLDGVASGSGDTWNHTFSTPGVYEVVCVSRGPASGIIGKFYTQRYSITVVNP